MSQCKGCSAVLPEREPGQLGGPRKWCSETCRTVTHRRQNPTSYAPSKPRPPVRHECICKICGVAFESPRPEAAVCSKRCRNSSMRHLRKERRDKERGRRIHWTAVAERDGLDCWLCGDPCDPDDFEWCDGRHVSGLTFPSVDHVVPLSSGGANDMANVRLAHHHCNCVKGDRLAA